MIVRAKFTKENYLKYLSHLDLMRLFHRALNRSKLQLKYTKGFNPQPKISIANPLPLGVESVSEYIDIELEKDIAIEKIKDILIEELPKEIRIIDIYNLEDPTPLSSLIRWSLYEITFSLVEKVNKEKLLGEIDTWLNNSEILINKIKYKKRRPIERIVNIRPLIDFIKLNKLDNNEMTIEVCLKSGDSGNLRAGDFIDSFIKGINLPVDKELTGVTRIEQLIGEDKLKVEG